MFKTFASALIAYSVSAVQLDQIENTLFAEVASGAQGREDDDEIKKACALEPPCPNSFSQTTEYKDPSWNETVNMLMDNYGYPLGKRNKKFMDLGTLKGLVEEFDGE
jgi:hypothetical protein